MSVGMIAVTRALDVRSARRVSAELAYVFKVAWEIHAADLFFRRGFFEGPQLVDAMRELSGAGLLIAREVANDSALRRQQFGSSRGRGIGHGKSKYFHKLEKTNAAQLATLNTSSNSNTMQCI